MNQYEVLSSLCSQLDFALQVCSAIRHGRDWFEQESKDCYDIWLITEGRVKVELEGKALLLLPGDVFLMYPQRMYSACCVGDGCSFVFVRFDVILGKNLRPLDSFALEGKTLAENIDQETGLFLRTYEHYRDGEAMASLALKAALMMLVSKIAAVKAARNDPADVVLGKSPYLKLEKLMSYIQQNIDRPLSIKNLAEYVCMSEKYFITFFKYTTGMTPHAYISQIKLKRAFTYLSERKYSVKETAQMLGFSDQYTFSRAFKRYYGFPPSDVGR